MNLIRRSSFFIIFIPFFILADKYCLDNSKHMDPCLGPDFKRYYLVDDCYCPCNRYAQSFNRGRCERCWHYRAPQDLETIAAYDARFE